MNRRGSLLISTLWIMMILSLLALGAGFRVSMEGRLCAYFLNDIRAEALAGAAIAQCGSFLAADTNDYDSFYECGAMFASPTDTGLAATFTEVAVDGGTFSVAYRDDTGAIIPGMADEERKININKTSQAVLESIFGPDVAAAVTDWRDVDTFGTGGVGFEDSFCKNSDFLLPEEILLVKGMTRELYDSVKGYVTVYGDGKVNINTVSQKVLVLLGMTDDSAAAVVAYRNGYDGQPGTGDDGIFTPATMSATLDGLLRDQPAASVADLAALKSLFTTTSNYFKIECRVTPAGSRISRDFEAVITRDEQWADRVVYYHE